MHVRYRCKHCFSILAELNHQRLTFEQLGFRYFTTEEQKQMTKKTESGVVDVFVICESCEDALKTYPDYHELDYFIH
ncbi:Protein of unknown function [Pelagirhabdus alkalitolerans]|uniref:Uncharacterized protein n=1 Tax=Pelagirhabdus alkalitolerans TaxID=1612202 RepID=A0A1G6MJ02_9BACI|nr:anti-sigma-F factor Fin [Pelagirhabdus alkalitolerans]SDC55489.1 Protein of unknown function [Pelagirhabdus alkalitolerans]